MKIQNTVFLIVLVFSFVGRTQSYTRILTDLNEWHFTTCFSGCNTDIYYTDGDTIVNGKHCKILDGYHYISRTFLLHEDTLLKQVTLLSVLPEKIKSYLLYDFSKVEGDSMELVNPVTPFLQDAGYYHLDSIRFHPLEDGNLYKHFYWSPTASNSVSIEYPVWIEGVGSLSLINAPGGTPDLNHVGNLSCLFKNNTSFYSNLDSIVDCEPTHFLSVLESDQPLIQSYPNPVNSKIHFSEQAIGQEYSLLDLNGNVLDHRIIDPTGTIDLNSFAPGFYFLQIANQKLIRFVKE